MKQPQSEALEAAKKNVISLPTSAKFHNEYGDALYVLERYSEALICYDQALNIRRELEYLVNSGLCLIHLEEKEKALGIFEEVTQADPKYLSSRSGQFESLNRYEDAAKICEMIQLITQKKPLNSTSFSISHKSSTTTQKIPQSQTIAQTVMPPPKPKVSPEQLILQDKLIAACKQGDEKAVKALLQQGAKPDMVNAKGEHPLGAAVWGMCPDIVNTLLKQADGVAPMTWEECEKHNMFEYKEVFIVPKFNPQNFKDWHQLLKKMESNSFIQAFHLSNAKKQYGSRDWGWLLERVAPQAHNLQGTLHIGGVDLEIRLRTEEGLATYRSQIKEIVSAKQPTMGKTF